MTSPTNIQRFELDSALAGRHVLIDTDECTIGVLEDMQSGNIPLTLDAFSRVIVGGNLPGFEALSSDDEQRQTEVRNVLRRLKPKEFRALVTALGGAFLAA